MLPSRLQGGGAAFARMDFPLAVHGLLGRATGCTQASIKCGLQGALHALDAHVVEVKPVAVLGFEDLNEQVIQGDRFEQKPDLVG